MVRIASSLKGRGLALALLIGLGVLTPLEALTQEDQPPAPPRPHRPRGRTQSRRPRNRNRSSS